MRVGIIGYGLIGHKRADALQQLKKEGYPLESIGIYDPDIMNYIVKENSEDKIYFSDYFKFVDNYDPDFVIIATPHYVSYDYIIDMLDKNAKILIEKPFCDTYARALSIYNRLLPHQEIYVGFNYRFYDGVALLINDISFEKFGKLISVNMSIGHGGKPKDKESWKLNPDMAGIGSLLDPGIHMLDLLGLMFTNIIPVAGTKWKGFWNTGVIEDVHLLLKTDLGCSINLETSLTKWKNTFRIEINGTEGYGIVEGRGGNYGQQTYTLGKRWGWMNSESQKDSEEIICKTDCNTSFYDELNSLFGNEDDYLLPPCSSTEALRTMALYEKCLEVLI